MEQVLILLVMLSGVTHAFWTVAETKCDATHNTSQCSATLGGSVYIQVMNNASFYQLRCKKQLPTGPVHVFSVKKDKVTIQEPFTNRTEFFISNRTLKISNVERDDAGQYSVEVFDQNGVLVKNININLEVKENISPTEIVAYSAVGVALIVGVVVVIFCCVCCVRRRKKSGSGKQQKKQNKNTVNVSLD